MRKLYTLLCVLAIGFTANAQRNLIYATQSGSWTSNSTWNLNRQPANNDSIVIPSGKTVTLSADKALSNVIIDIFGTLAIDEPSGGGSSNSLDISTTNSRSTDPVIRLFDANSKLKRGVNSTGSGRIRVRVNGAGSYYTKYVTGSTDLTGPAVAYNNNFAGFDFNSNGALPVILVDYSVYNTDKVVNLKWRSQQENNSDHYSVERSVDGRSWTSIGSVPAVVNSTVPQNYAFTDARPLNGINYYRLRIVDRDGKFGLTPVKGCRMSASKVKLSIYPNPAVSTASIVINQEKEERFDVMIYNKTGQLMARHRSAEGSNIITFDVSHLPQGDYIADVVGNNGTKQTLRFIVGKQ